MSPDDPRHGTNAGYMAHQKLGEKACDPCRAGRATYQRRRDYDRLLGRPRIVPSLGAQRRIRALQRLGWSLRMIANDAGWNHPEDLHWVLHNPTCNRKTWLRIAQTYERLCMTVPPYCSATVRARKRAERLDYAPPLAWDDIDDPNEQPSGATLATVTPIRERTWDTADHRACPRCGVVRSTYADGLRGDLCRDCRQEVA